MNRMLFLRNCLFSVLFLFVWAEFAPSSIAAEETPVSATDCRWAHAPIRIDGIADEPIWRDAQQVGESLRLLWNRTGLYFWIDSPTHSQLFIQPPPQHPAKHPGRYLLVFGGKSRKAYFVTGKPSGLEQLTGPSFEWQAKLTEAITGEHSEWEGHISWKSLMRSAGRPESDEVWKIGLQDFEQPVDHIPAKLHRIRFRGPRDSPSSLANAAAVIKLDHWTTSRVYGSPDPPKPYLVKRAFPQLKLDWPICARQIPGSDWLLAINERSPYARSQLHVLKDTDDISESTAILDFDGVAYDIAIHPDFHTNRFIFIGSNTPKHPDGHHCQITRHQLTKTAPFQLVPESAKLILEWKSNGHNGAALAFGLDKMLYVTTGDGTARRDLNEVGQRLDTLLAKVLRIDVDHPSSDAAYSIPKDNPFVDFPGARGETWCYGLRNPWRITVDSKSGRIWVGNNGQDLWEQVYLIDKGANYGWSVFEGGHLFIAERQRGPTPISPPTFDHPHSEARSLTGGIVYYGSKLPDLFGAYLYGDYSTGKIWAAKHDGKQVTWHREIADTALAITGFAIDSKGELLIADHRGNGEGGFYRLVPNKPENDPTPFPQLLSETGLFESTSHLAPSPGVVPYSVNVSAWHDGATADRLIAVPVEQDAPPAVGFVESKAWQLPEGAVLAQTLSMPAAMGRPARRLETRILTKQQGEWSGYSYAWTNDQQDAKLMPATGGKIMLDDSRQGSQITWQVPSRSECMACHSRAANYLLGINTLQLNRNHTYPKKLLKRSDRALIQQANQLEVFEQLGWFTFNWKNEASRNWERQLPDKKQRALAVKTLPGQKQPTGQTAFFYSHPRTRAKLPDTLDESVALDRRADAYLHANCAHCHVSDGGGNAKIILSWNTPLANRNLVSTEAMHGSFGIDRATLLTPGRPDLSILNYRMHSVGGGRMPRVGSHEVDPDAAALIHSWIASMDSPSEYATRQKQVARQWSEIDSKKGPSIELENPQIAIIVLDLIRSGEFSKQVADATIAAGLASVDPAIRDLFEGLVPASERVIRLGASFDRSAILTLKGDRERGRRVFAGSTTLCRNCHRIGNEGKAIGPDLTKLKSERMTTEFLLESILSPSKVIDQEYATYSVLTEEGIVIHGLQAPGTTDKQLVIQQLDGKTHTIARSSIEQMRKLPTSLMPDLLLKDLTAQEAADLLAYLASLSNVD